MRNLIRRLADALSDADLTARHQSDVAAQAIQAMKAADSRLALATADTERRAWLIERGQPENQAPTLWSAGDVGDWTTDPRDAIRFPTREAAQQAIDNRSGYASRQQYGRAVLHVFLNAARFASLTDTPEGA